MRRDNTPDMNTEDGRQQMRAMLLALSVRNAMEGTFHGPGGLITDERMPEFNTLVRNAIYTALCILDEAAEQEWAEQMLHWAIMTLPDYWELPELTESAKRMMEGAE